MALQERSAGVVVYRRGKQGREYLLLDYGRYWDLPKGHVEPGETDRVAALRELKEETGIDDAQLAENFAHEVTYFFRTKKGLVRKTVVFFLAATQARTVTISHEHEGFVWLPFAAAVGRITYANARTVLQAAEATAASSDEHDRK
jgi:8-oxo-dGTP pyrophosphatase MutT (NUDIX family)